MKFGPVSLTMNLLFFLLFLLCAFAISVSHILLERKDLYGSQFVYSLNCHSYADCQDKTFQGRILTERTLPSRHRHDEDSDDSSDRSLQQPDWDHPRYHPNNDDNENHMDHEWNPDWDPHWNPNWDHNWDPNWDPDWDPDQRPSNHNDSWLNGTHPNASRPSWNSSTIINVSVTIEGTTNTLSNNVGGSNSESLNQTTVTAAQNTSLNGNKNSSTEVQSGQSGSNSNNSSQGGSNMEYFQNSSDISKVNMTTIPPHSSCLKSGFYLFPNGSCLSNCPLSTYIVQTTQDGTGQLVCTPCESSCLTCSILPSYCTSCPSERPYLYTNQSCMQSCPTGFHIEVNSGHQFCIENKKPSSVASSVTSLHSVGGKIASISIACSLLGGSSSPIFKILLINLIQYIKYLNIEYPETLAIIFNNQVGDVVNLDFMAYIPNLDAEAIQNHTVPHRFARYGVSGLFVVNYWEETLTTLALGIFALFSVCIKTSRSYIFSQFINWGRGFLIWNFFIAFLSSNLGDIVIYSILEFQNLKLTDGYAYISLLFNIIFVTTAFFMQSYIFVKLAIMRRTQKNIPLEEKVSLHPKIKILFEEGNNRHLLQEINIFIAGTKMILSSVIVGILDAPVLQASLLLTLNVAMILYLVIYRPIRVGWKNFELVLYEVLVMIADAACLNMSLKGPSEQCEDSIDENVIIVMNFMLLISLLLFQGFEHVRNIRQGIKIFLQKRKSAKIYPECYLDRISDKAINQKKITDHDEVAMQKWILTFFKRRNKNKICPQTSVPQIQQIQIDMQTDVEDLKTGSPKISPIGPQNEDFRLNRELSGQTNFEKTETLNTLLTENQENETQAYITMITVSDYSPKSDQNL